MHLDVSAISAQGQIQGEAQIGHEGGGSLLQKTSSDWKATNGMHSNDLEACEMKCCCFGSISKSNFWHVNLAYLQKCSLYSGERSVPLGALVICKIN